MKRVMPVVFLAGLALAVIALVEVREVGKRLDRIEGRLGGRDQVDCNQSDTVARVRQSVVRIVGGESEGSGFAIREGGFILTNYHVIEFEPNPKVILSNGLFYTGTIVLTNKDADLAVIKIDRDLPVLRLKSAKWLKPAEEIFSVGFPLGGAIAGEASVTRGLFSGLRHYEEEEMTYVQTDASMAPGVSGGPMVDICGDAVGVNTAGIFSLNLGIDADTVRRKILATASGADPAMDAQTVDFNPGQSPYESVRAFYNFLKARRLDKAFELLSDNFRRGYSFDQWAQGYQPLLDTTIIDLSPDLEIDNRIHVKLSTKDFIHDQIIPRYFEGYWDVKLVNGQWLLWDPEIWEIENPVPDWYQSTESKLEEIRGEIEHARALEEMPDRVTVGHDSPITAKSSMPVKSDPYRRFKT